MLLCSVVAQFAAMAASHIVGGSEDASIVGSDEAERAAAPRSRRPVASREGPWKLILLVVCASGFWAGDFEGDAPESWLQTAGDEALIVGAAVAPWVMASMDSEPKGAIQQRMRQLASKRCRAQDVFGYIEYPIAEVVALAQPVLAQGVSAALSVFGALSEGAFVSTWRPGQAEPPGHQTLGDVRQHWRNLGLAAGAMTIFSVAACVAAKVVEGTTNCLHVVPVTRRVARRQLLSQRQPTARQLASFIDDVSTTPAVANVAPGTLARAGPSLGALPCRPRLGVGLVGRIGVRQEYSGVAPSGHCIWPGAGPIFRPIPCFTGEQYAAHRLQHPSACKGANRYTREAGVAPFLGRLVVQERRGRLPLHLLRRIAAEGGRVFRRQRGRLRWEFVPAMATALRDRVSTTDGCRGEHSRPSVADIPHRRPTFPSGSRLPSTSRVDHN